MYTSHKNTPIHCISFNKAYTTVPVIMTLNDAIQKYQVIKLLPMTVKIVKTLLKNGIIKYARSTELHIIKLP